MNKKRCTLPAILMFGFAVLYFSQTAVFAQEAENGSEMTESSVSNAKTALEDDSAVLTLTPGGEDETAVEITSYTADKLPMPEGLFGGSKENPAQIIEYGTDDEGNDTCILTRAVYDENDEIIGCVVSTKSAGNSNFEKQESWTVVEGEDGLYYMVSAAMSDITSTDKDAVESIQSIQPEALEQYYETIVPGVWDDEVMLRNPPAESEYVFDEDAFDEYAYRYLNQKAESSVLVHYVRNNSSLITPNTMSTVYLFTLVDAQGNQVYAYCADMSTSTVKHAGYNIENIEDAVYYDGDAAKHIQAIAAKGYWGTKDGIGSLESVKQFLRESSSLTEEEISLVTPGMAMSATQAALWQYGDSGTVKQLFYSNPIYYYSTNPYMVTKYSYTKKQMSAQQIEVAKTLVHCLAELDPNTMKEASASLITKNNFAKETSILLKGQDASNPSLFKTDITFTLGAAPGENDDLVAVVRDVEGNVLALSRLAGLLQDGEAMAASQKTDSGILYTISDVWLADGASLILNLSGTQHFGLGAYLYSSNVYTESQSFVGLASGIKNVDLWASLTFHVQEPTVQVQHDSNVFVTTASNIVEKADEEQTPDKDSSLTKDPEEEIQEENKEQKKEDKKDKKKSSTVDTASQTNLGWTWIFLALSFAAVLKLAALKRH